MSLGRGSEGGRRGRKERKEEKIWIRKRIRKRKKEKSTRILLLVNEVRNCERV